MSHGPIEQVCTHPHHHVHDAPGLVAAVAAICEERGLRLTELRERVLTLIAQEGRPIKAYDLLERMRAVQGAVAPPTVYRALDFLLQSGFIHKLESINAFVACHHPRIEHSVPFLICDQCHDAIELEDEEIPQLLRSRAEALGFKPLAQTLEVHGRCARCLKSD
ncbi:Fur family transcriptional regulator [Pseudomarimonas arenosa]|uniref:Ferric uptake regulation protein n=1 Tax=Pseudomarimonas arenosa TaxID=2774145 RepID=A0AAW3ZMK0_9GAMM|nr:Fur family transcriptional regulator [Pseudomarimonas arenosa]MBD8527188.1 transcriptional repressor [Pseudomarimonas arenosa]